MALEDPFINLDAHELGAVAERHGFKHKGKRNWIRRTADFVQLVNLQNSMWSRTDHYLNFALWPLAMGEPPTIAESKFEFRARAEDLGATDLQTFFAAANSLRTLSDLRDAERSGSLAGCYMSGELRDLLT